MHKQDVKRYIDWAGPVQYPGDPEHHHHEHSVPDQRPEFGHFGGVKG